MWGEQERGVLHFHADPSVPMQALAKVPTPCGLWNPCDNGLCTLTTSFTSHGMPRPGVVSDDVGKNLTFHGNQRPVSVHLARLLTLASTTLCSQEPPEFSLVCLLAMPVLCPHHLVLI